MISPPPVAPPSIPPSELLRDKLAGLRRKHIRTAVLTGLALLVTASIEVLALVMFFDWLIDFPWAFRLALLAGQSALFGYITVRFILWPILRQPDDDELALLVEKARPILRTRLIASIQLTRPGTLEFGASPALAGATVKETETISRPLDFSGIVPTDRLRRLGLLALFVLGVAAFAMLYGQTTTRDLLKRAFLSQTPVPRKTRVFVQDGNKIIGRGDSVRLEALAQGMIPSSGTVEVKYPSRRTQEYKLEPDKENRARFGRTIDNVQDSLSYVVFLNDGRSETYQVKAIPRPTVLAIDCEQQYPAYTRLPPARRSLGDLSLLSGSVLKLKVTATKDIATASLKLVGLEANASLQIDAQQPRQLSGQLTVPAKGLTGFSVQLRDTEGMDSIDSVIYRVDIIPDKPPVVRLTYPDRKEELITRHATLLVGLDIADDFEISKVRLRYKVYPLIPGLDLASESTANDAVQQSLDLDLEGVHPQKLKRRYEWPIGSFNPILPEGTRLEFWLEAEDNNNVTGPGIGVSEHQFAKIVSDSEKRADLLNRAGDYLGSISDVAGDQEKLNRNLGLIIREKSNPK